jgi:ATP-dependent DNA helicase RecG
VMGEKNIKRFLNTKEFQNMEWKQSLSEKREIGETVSAFANTNDGIIFAGVSPEGNIVGVHIGKGRLEQLANYIKQCTKPEVYLSIAEHRIDGKDVIEVSVKEAIKKPVFFNGRAFKRVGRSNHYMSPNEIAEAMTYSGLVPHWDERICRDATSEDIDAGMIRWFLEKARSERGSDISSDISTDDVLERLDLARKGQITNGAILLFGKDPQKFFRQAETKCGRFKGKEPIEFIDMKVFGGSIIEQREDALEFVKEHIKLHAKIIGTERVETWEYPIEAIREAITNAICHRDYELPSNVQVRVFDDRIETWGCGPLPEPLTVEDLKSSHRSILRNPSIGKCFFRIRFIEQWGTGTNRIIASCQEYGLPEPLFEERADGLVVTLRKVTEEMIEELTEKEMSIIGYLEDKGSISTKECLSLLISSRGTAQRYLSLLERKGIILRRGRGRNTRYILSPGVDEAKVRRK